MFSGASSIIGKETDTAFLLVTGACMVLFVIIIFFMLYFLSKYSRDRNPNPVDIEGHPLLEISFLVISVLLVVFMFFAGLGGYRKIKKEFPAGAMVVKANAQQWAWSFEYANGRQSSTLNLPVNKPVKMVLNSRDVIHGFFIPAFRVKQDVMPGAEKYTWFTPDSPGTYDLFCTQYCGTGHSAMLTKAVVLAEDRFNEWVQEAKAPEAAKPGGASLLGKKLFEAKGCKACHTVDGTKLVGPTLKGLYGSKVKVTTGGKEREITVDEEYIRRSELEPNADIVAGFPPSVMPPQKGLLSEEEIKALIEYIKSLK